MMRSFRSVSAFYPKVETLYLYHEDLARTQGQKASPQASHAWAGEFRDRSFSWK
jgi:hypothetical protein